MNWAIAGLLYGAVYIGAMWVLGDHLHARMLLGNAGLLLPPAVPIAVIVRRRARWRGRQALFLAAIASWAALWLIGQIAWAWSEVFLSTPVPWFRWYVVLQMCGSAVPLIAIIAWPHRGTDSDSAVTVALDVVVLLLVTGFVYWSTIIAPGLDPAHTALAQRSLAFIGPTVRMAAAVGLIGASIAAGKSAWAAVYRRLAGGMLLAFPILIFLSGMFLRTQYQTGSAVDVGWMLPFWFAAWAAATAPGSEMESPPISLAAVRHAPPVLLYIALVSVPAVGYGVRYAMPLGETVDRLRDLATAFTLLAGIALVMVRLRVEQLAADRADERVRLLATACEHAAELILIIQGSRIAYANDAFCRAVGYPRDELCALQPEQFVAAESRDEIARLREQLRARQVVRAMTRMSRRDGSTFQASWSAATIVDAHGHIRFVVGVIRDLTEDLHLREQLVRSERLSAIGELVSGVAHEINNPLQSFIGSLDVLLHQPSDPATRADLERARREAARAGRIIRNLLTFARRSPEERLLVDLNEVVQAAISLCAYDLELAGIQIRQDYAPSLPLVLANRQAIQQIVAHLVINAQQAMSPNGGGILTVKTFARAGYAALDVQDNGPGVAPHVRSRIFEPFVTTKPEVTGTGLGLSLSFGIAHAHGGTLELVPTDEGACFRLRLPGAGFPGPEAVPTPLSSAG